MEKNQQLWTSWVFHLHTPSHPTVDGYRSCLSTSPSHWTRTIVWEEVKAPVSSSLLTLILQLRYLPSIQDIRTLLWVMSHVASLFRSWTFFSAPIVWDEISESFSLFKRHLAMHLVPPPTRACKMDYLLGITQARWAIAPNTSHIFPEDTKRQIGLWSVKSDYIANLSIDFKSIQSTTSIWNLRWQYNEVRRGRLSKVMQWLFARTPSPQSTRLVTGRRRLPGLYSELGKWSMLEFREMGRLAGARMTPTWLPCISSPKVRI